MRYDFLTKNLVRTFDWNNLGQNRSISEEVCINGRKYLKTGVTTSTTVVGNLYLVYDQSVKRNKYVLLVGIARQHPNDLQVKRNEGIEIANLKSLDTPVMQIEFDHEVTWDEFEQLAEWYVEYQTPRFLKTSDEIKQSHKNNNLNYSTKYPQDDEAFKLYSTNK